MEEDESDFIPNSELVDFLERVLDRCSDGAGNLEKLVMTLEDRLNQKPVINNNVNS